LGPAFLATALALGAACPPVPAFSGIDPPGDVPRHWHFQVFLDGRPIGEHDFTVTGEHGSEQVSTHARFSVKALFIPLYGYVHQDTEVWRGGCLERMEAQTTDNGHASRVLGRRTESGFEVHGPQGTTVLPQCISSFAYWDRARLRDARLLNAQSGAYEPVALTEQGAESIVSQGRRIGAERYCLAASKFTIRLWYSSTGQWLALESRTAEGHTLRYEML
jgi:Family of unknown function (DUF6134)